MPQPPDLTPDSSVTICAKCEHYNPAPLAYCTAPSEQRFSFVTGAMEFSPMRVCISKNRGKCPDYQERQAA